MNALEREICAQIDERMDSLAGYTTALVRHRSVYGQEGEVQRWIASDFQSRGLLTDIWEPSKAELMAHPAYAPVELDYVGRPNVVGVLKGTGGGRSLLFNAHVDVVPAGDLGQWREDPWTGRVTDGRVFGRGTADMKGALAAFVAALEAVTARARPRGDIIVESVIEEETGGNGTLAAVLRGYRADGAIVGEPTSLDIIVGHQGSLWFRIRVPGRASHAAYKWKGVSAIEKAMVVYQALMDLEHDREPLCTSDMFKEYEVRTPVSIGVMRAGDWPATIPDLAELEGRIGVLPGETLDEVRRAVEARVAVAAAGDTFLRGQPPSVEWLGTRIEPAEIDPAHPLVRLTEDVVGVFQPVKVYGKLAGTDMRHLVRYGGTPTLVLGPGDDELAHVANESVGVERLARAAKMYALIILRWCN